MNQKKKNLKYRRVSNKLKKVGGLKKATYAQVEHIYKMLMLKYVMSLENQLTEDKHHLYLKQNTIQTLEEEIKHKNIRLMKWIVWWEKHQKDKND